jgi:NAD(P)-dependent dehydrogenase (short-subunit alcohol dehydrogenase family)
MNHAGQLAGQVAAVTGGSGAIGGAILRALAAAGANAVSLDVAAPAASGAAWEECDLRQDNSVAAALERLFARHARLDIVVHAAGVSRDAVVWKTSVEDWDLVHSVNLRGAFLLLRHAIPLLRRGPGGRIVLIGSINGSRGKFGTSAYSSSKVGLLGLARSVARETGRLGILVNVVEPGWVRTPMTEKLSAEIRQTAVQESLLGALVEPEDVAAAVLYLCGPSGRRVTGQILRVDGGQFLGGA